jgi:hypothetical protein
MSVPVNISYNTEEGFLFKLDSGYEFDTAPGNPEAVNGRDPQLNRFLPYPIFARLIANPVMLNKQFSIVINSDTFGNFNENSRVRITRRGPTQRSDTGYGKFTPDIIAFFNFLINEIDMHTSEAKYTLK